MKICANQQSFGAIVKTKSAEKYIHKLPYEKDMAIQLMEMDNKHKKIDVFVSTIVKNGKEKIKAEVGHKNFIENFFRDSVATIRKGVKFANKLEEEQNIQNELTKEMYIPTLK